MQTAISTRIKRSRNTQRINAIFFGREWRRKKESYNILIVHESTLAVERVLKSVDIYRWSEGSHLPSHGRRKYS